MGLTAIDIVKNSVKNVSSNQWNVTWTLKGYDELEAEISGFERDFTAYYNKGQDISMVESVFQADMQAYIDRYEKEQQYLNALTHDTSVATVKASLIVGG